MKNKATGLAILGALLCVVMGVLATMAFMPDAQVVEVEKPVLVNVPYNDTEVRDLIANVQDTLDEADNWADEAKALALADIEKELDDDIYDFLISENVSVEDEDSIDIYKIKDVDVDDSDSDDQDATITHIVRLDYEDEDGDDKRVNIEVVTEIEEGEVEDVEYSLA